MDRDDLVSLRSLWAHTERSVPRHEARWLCEVATALDGAEFDDALDEPVTERMVHHLDAMLARYRGGEPLPYVLGRWSFRHIDLAVDPRVLIPRPETESVAGTAIDLARAVPEHRVVADLGTGSGAIGLSLAAELPLVGTTVWLTDTSDDALAVASANLAGIGRPAANVRVARGSWFEALPTGELFDVIVSNPPYVATASTELATSVLDWEPAAALFAGDDGLDALRSIIGGAAHHLAPGGWLVLEIGADHGSAVRSLLTDAGFVGVEIRSDFAGHDRIAIGRTLTGARSQ